jgi:gamma-glutamylcyclotransferase (GGCT)/AIG2-like uncharacterized protein YtfP
MHLFAYGTLMFPEVWERVAGKQFVSEPATLDGFLVRRVADDVYPVLLRGDAHDRAAGLVFRDIDDNALAALDDYESSFYDRIAVVVTSAANEPLECQAYVLPKRLQQEASDEPWTADEFAACQLTAYLERLR